MKWITANDIAGDNPNAQKSYRQALRDARLPWYVRYARWKVAVNSSQHRDMLRVYKEWRERSN